MLPEGRIKRLLVVIMRWAAAGLVFWIIYKRIHFADLRLVFDQIRWDMVVLGLAFEMARIMIAAASALWVLRSFGMAPHYLEVVRVNLQAAFFGVVSDWLGAAARWGGMAYRLGIPARTAFASISVETYLVWVCALGVNMLFGPHVIGIWRSSEEHHAYIGALGIFAGMLIIMAVAVRWFPRLGVISKMHDGLADVNCAKWLPAMTWMVVQFCCSAQFLVILSAAVGFELSFIKAIWICGFANVIQSLPGALFGWSLRVGILVFLLPRLGGTVEQGTIIGLASGLISLTGVGAGAIDFLIESVQDRDRIKDVQS